MNKAMIRSMTEAEQRLLAETERDALRGLDEDALLDLHARIRRARTKYVKLYRRQSSVRVVAAGGRGKAHAVGQRDRDKAEVFEGALALVSRHVAVVAKAAASELRAERLEAARSARGAGPAPKSSPARTVSGEGRARVHRKTTGGVKKDASTRSAGARRQGKRDARG